MEGRGALGAPRIPTHLTSLENEMSKGLPRSLSRGSPAVSEIVKQTIKLDNVPLISSGATGVGFGTAVFGDFPEGNILILGLVSYIQVKKDTVAGAAGVIDAFTGSYSVGSAPTADATLSGGEIDLIPATTLAAATAGVSPLTRAVNAAQAILDNTDGTLEINLNLLLDDASVSADTQHLKVSGQLFLAYIVLGDD